MMMMMKNPVILVACVLLFSALAVLASENSFGPDDCCFTFVTKRLPKDKVAGYKYTDGRCTKKAVIFTMMRGTAICASPSNHWVMNIVNFIRAKEAINSPTEPTHVSAPHHRAH